MQTSGIPEELQAKIIGILSVLFPQAKIYLFGSRARGTHYNTSDIDIGIEGAEPFSWSSIDEANEMLAMIKTPYKIEVVDLNALEDTFKSIVDKQKVLWKS
jgi:predicted nucleotidyltransferase